MCFFKRTCYKCNYSLEKENVIINKNELKLHQDATECYICGKRCIEKFANKKNYRKVRDHCDYTRKHRGEAHSICNLKLNVPNEIPLVLNNGSDYDNHFIIKELANVLGGQFECLGKNTES